MKTAAIIAAAGSGRRMGADRNKVLLPVAGQPVIYYTMSAFARCGITDSIILVTRECDIAECEAIAGRIDIPVRVIAGGNTRQESVFLGLKAAHGTDIAVIHDGARALVTREIIESAVKNAVKYGAAAAGVPSKDSLKTVASDGFITATVDRASTYLIQTPQVFNYNAIVKAHSSAQRDGFCATDDCAIYEKYCGKIKLTEGSYDNIKLTTPIDMIIAEQILKIRKKER